jgi:hypothetical protein
LHSIIGSFLVPAADGGNEREQQKSGPYATRLLEPRLQLYDMARARRSFRHTLSAAGRSL